MSTSLFSFLKELIREINTYGFSLFDLVRELEQREKTNLELIKNLDFTIEQMKKELKEREISNKRYLQELQKDKLEKQTREMFRKW